jgi:hypothetical protein
MPISDAVEAIEGADPLAAEVGQCDRYRLAALAGADLLEALKVLKLKDIVLIAHACRALRARLKDAGIDTN